MGKKYTTDSINIGNHNLDASMMASLNTVVSNHGSYLTSGDIFSGNYNDLTNKPTIPSLNGYATQSYVTTQINNLVASAPGSLNTLNELAAALGDDANFSTTVTNSIAAKLPKTGGTMTGNLTIDTGASSNALVIKGTSPTISFLDDDGGDDFYIHTNSNNFFVLANRDANDLVGTGWESPYPLQLEADTNRGYLFGSRMFAENYHPNADKWTTARTLSLSGDVTGSVSWDGSGNASITATVQDDSHNHTISNIDSLQSALDNKASASHNHDDRYYTETESNSRFVNVTGDTITGGLTISGSLSRGNYTSVSNYHTGADNIVLKGNSVGISGIFFESEKNGTNINHSSDFGFIQYHSYGTSTSGEANELIIGVSNDSTDHVILNAPHAEGLRFRVGSSETDYKIYHEGHKPTASDIGAAASSHTHSQYLTNSPSYLGLGTGANTSGGYRLNMGGGIDMNNHGVDYVSQLHFQDNVRFYDNGDDSLLNFKYGDANTGGIRILNGSATHKGTIYADNSGFGLLDNDSQWAIRTQTGSNPLELRCNNNVEFKVYESYTLSPGSSRAPIFYDSSNTSYYVNPAGTSKLGYAHFDGYSDASGNARTSTGVSLGRYNSEYAHIDIASSNANGGWIDFSDASGEDYGGRIRYYNSSDYMSFYAGGSNEEFRVRSSYTESMGSSRAPTFYDSNNTSYYLNASSTSVLNSLDVKSIQKWYRSGGSANQRADSRLDGSDQARMHWYGENDSGSTTNFKHAWYDGNDYIDVTASSPGRVTFSGSAAEIYIGTNQVYHEGHKPTASEIGAAASSHTHNYVSEGGTSFNGVYPMVVRVSSNNIYSDSDITFTGSNSQLFVGGSIKTPVLYDSNNTSYYVNPASNSNLNILEGFTASFSGNVYASNFILQSDKRLKTKITDLPCNNIDVNWKSFEIKKEEGDYRTGVIAQELEETHPEFVNTDSNGFKSVKYIDLLIAKIAELEARLDKLEK
jgi:hypothetical protein